MKKEAETKKEEGAASSGDAFGSSKVAEVKPVSSIAVKRRKPRPRRRKEPLAAEMPLVPVRLLRLSLSPVLLSKEKLKTKNLRTRKLLQIKKLLLPVNFLFSTRFLLFT